MPYISSEERELYLAALNELLDGLNSQLENDLGGHLNYCISYLITHLWKSESRYFRANTIRGAVENAHTEWYLCHVLPYEKLKRVENGDV